MSRTATADLPQLRFRIGDRVQCRTGTGEYDWSPGTVVKHWYREPQWESKRIAPYQVKLDDGRLIFAPLDDSRVIKELTGVLTQGKIPVTVLTGFLGAGKTTLLNYLIKAQHGKRYAIIENEVGAVGVDNILLQESGYGKTNTTESVTLLDNGCLCCTVRDDLVGAIQGIVDAANAKEESEGKRLDGILIETTGVADPGPICKTFYGDPLCSTYCKIDGVITVVDAVHFVDQLTRPRSDGAVNESAQQVAFADKVLLNKVDAVSTEQLQRTSEALRGVNSFVPVTKCSLGKSPDAVPLQELLAIDAFDLTKLLSSGTDLDLSVCGAVSGEAEDADHAASNAHAGGAHAGHGGYGGHGDVHGAGHGHGHDCGESCEHESHGGGHGHGHVHGHSPEFRHDSGIGSFVCEVVGTPFDIEKFQDFMQELMKVSDSLYRYKGILAMQEPHGGKVMRRVLQGVHDMAEMELGHEWPKDKPYKSQVVLIGKGLDRAKWQTEFKELAAK